MDSETDTSLTNLVHTWIKEGKASGVSGLPFIDSHEIDPITGLDKKIFITRSIQELAAPISTRRITLALDESRSYDSPFSAMRLIKPSPKYSDWRNEKHRLVLEINAKHPATIEHLDHIDYTEQDGMIAFFREAFFKRNFDTSSLLANLQSTLSNLGRFIVQADKGQLSLATAEEVLSLEP